MTTLAELKEKKDKYVEEQAQEIVNRMLKAGSITSTVSLATCDAPNWDIELHRTMPEIIAVLQSKGIRTTGRVRHGVNDWVFSLI